MGRDGLCQPWGDVSIPGAVAELGAWNCLSNGESLRRESEGPLESGVIVISQGCPVMPRAAEAPPGEPLPVRGGQEA